MSSMMIIYLVVIWLIFTLVVMGGKLKQNAAVMLVWFALTSVAAWPVVRVVKGAPITQAIAHEIRTELDAEIRLEFPEWYAEREAGEEER